MKVLLVRPVNLEKVSFQISPDLGLGYLATALLREEHDVRILHCPKERMGLDNFVSYVREYRPDVVGFKVFTFDASSVRKGIELVKSVDATVTTIVGGAHPSGDPERTFEQFPEADWGLRGEAEIGLPLLLSRLASGSLGEPTAIPGLIWRDGDVVRCNQAHFSGDIDFFGMPAWHLMDPREYPPSPFGGFARSFPVAPIIATRGCPFPCTFCAGSLVGGKRLRKRSVDLILNEIELLHRDFGVREIQFVDDNLTYDRDFVMDLCSQIIDRGLTMYFSCPNGIRFDTLDEDLAARMRRAGFYSVALGIESASQETLERMKKMLDLDIVRSKVELLRKAGIKVTGFFIFGFPGDSKADMEKTIRFSHELKLDKASYYNFMPLPGSTIYDELAAQGELVGQQGGSHGYKVSYVPKGITARQLKRLQLSAFLSFYLRPRILWGLLGEVTSLEQLRILLNKVFRLVSMR